MLSPVQMLMEGKIQEYGEQIEPNDQTTKESNPLFRKLDQTMAYVEGQAMRQGVILGKKI